MFKGQCPTEKSDVFGLAITMWQIITRELPYQDENEHAVIFRVGENSRNKRTLNKLILNTDKLLSRCKVRLNLMLACNR